MPKAEDLVPIPKLALVCEKKLPAKCKPSTLTYCPSMDLIALASAEERVHVFRFNGQEALGGPFAKNGVGVRAVRWKGDGRMLAVAGSDGIVRLLSSQSGKTVHELRCATAGTARSDGAMISCLGWGVHFRDVGLPLTSLSHLKAELPRDLALLDVERSLPKLSVLPPTGDNDDIFSSRASLDSVFDFTVDASSGETDILTAGFDDGTLHLRIFNCFEIGSLNVRTSFPGTSSCKALRHASSPHSSTHGLLFTTTAPGSTVERLRLLTLDLQFISKSGQYLSLLASKITSLQNLLRYIKQVQNQIQMEWKSAHDLPSRYIANANEDLEEKCNCDFITASYHLLVTGDCFPPLREFLVDQVGERGHKRWEKAVGSGYEVVRRLTHECLLPALERCGVVLSRLIGLSKYHRLSPVLGLETKELKECLEVVDCLNLLGHKVLIHSGREVQEFFAFSKWLRHEIDLHAADPLSATAEEEMEKSDEIDYMPTLSYIRGAMTNSALHSFIKPSASAQLSEPDDLSTKEGSFYESYKTLLRRQQEQEKQGEAPILPTLGDLICRLSTRCDRVFKRIADTQKRGILHRSPLSLSPDCDERAIDIRTCAKDSSSPGVIQIASRSKRCPYKFYIYRVSLETVNGISSTKDISATAVSLQAGDIECIKFVEEDNALMLLWRDAEPEPSMHLVTIPLDPFPRLEPKRQIRLDPAKAADGARPNWEEVSEDLVVQLELLNPDREAWCIRHLFGDQHDSEPAVLAVNGRLGRRAVCVLDSDGLRYSVLDMDRRRDESDDEEEAALSA